MADLPDFRLVLLLVGIEGDSWPNALVVLLCTATV